MIGAIIGDYVGSAYEFAPTKRYNFKLVTPASSITDDSIISLAVADALLQPECDYKERMLYYGRKYPNPVGGYGNSLNAGLKAATHSHITVMAMARQCVYLQLAGRLAALKQRK